jgi:hypothetical protein
MTVAARVNAQSREDRRKSVGVRGQCSMEKCDFTSIVNRVAEHSRGLKVSPHPSALVQ